MTVDLPAPDTPMTTIVVVGDGLRDLFISGTPRSRGRGHGRDRSAGVKQRTRQHVARRAGRGID